MKPYVITDAAGKILRTGICQDHMVQAQKRSGEFAVEGRGRHDQHEVVEGRILTKPEAAARREQIRQNAEILVQREGKP